MRPDILIEYWTSLGKIQLIISGKRYLYYADLAVIKRFLMIFRVWHQPGKALNYLKLQSKLIKKGG